jgi:hypothetical protein
MRVIDIINEAITEQSIINRYHTLMSDINRFLSDNYEGPFYVDTPIQDRNPDNLSTTTRSLPVVRELMRFQKILKDIYGNGKDINFPQLRAQEGQLEKYILSQRRPSNSLVTNIKKPKLKGSHLRIYNNIKTRITEFLNSTEDIQLYSDVGYYRSQVTPDDYTILQGFIEYNPISEDDAELRVSQLINFISSQSKEYRSYGVRKANRERMSQYPMPPDLDLNNPLHEQWAELATTVILSRDCSITPLEMWDIIVKQQWRCALSNREFNTTNNRISIDRKDSTINYAEGNVWFTTHAVNIMKNELSIEQFVSLCKIVHDVNSGGANERI